MNPTEDWRNDRSALQNFLVTSITLCCFSCLVFTSVTGHFSSLVLLFPPSHFFFFILCIIYKPIFTLQPIFPPSFFSFYIHLLHPIFTFRPIFPPHPNFFFILYIFYIPSSPFSQYFPLANFIPSSKFFFILCIYFTLPSSPFGQCFPHCTRMIAIFFSYCPLFFMLHFFFCSVGVWQFLLAPFFLGSSSHFCLINNLTCYTARKWVILQATCQLCLDKCVGNVAGTL